MGLLERYKKPGGFVQLLSLLETCGPQKKEKFLSMIREENTAWENALRHRILSLDIIFSWPPEALAEIVTRTQPLTLVGLYLSCDPQRQEKLFTACAFSQQKKLKEMADEKKFTPAELNTSIEKFLIETRSLITQNILKIEKIDPGMEVGPDIEDKLNTYQVIEAPKSASNSGPAIPNVTVTTSTSTASHSTSSHSNVTDLHANHSRTNTPKTPAENPYLATVENPAEELRNLKKKYDLLYKENLELKQEIQSIKVKLEKIRRMA